MNRTETPTEMVDDMADYAERQIAPVYHGRIRPEINEQSEETNDE